MTPSFVPQLTAVSPRDVPIRETLQFLGNSPVGERPRVLEVGCGSGELAVRLREVGWSLTGIDIDASAVAGARQRGFEAIHADLLTFESDPFDVVLVTHSLHHISPLEAAVGRLFQLLRPGGWLVVEEFDFSAIEGETAQWFDDRKALLNEAGVLHADQARPHAQHRRPWPEQHRHQGHGQRGHHHYHPGSPPEHRLHTGAMMRQGIDGRFQVQFAEPAPYLYRYLCAELEPTDRGRRFAELVLEQERRALAAKRIQPVGLRLIARRPE